MIALTMPAPHCHPKDDYSAGNEAIDSVGKIRQDAYTVRFLFANGTCSLSTKDMFERNKPFGCFPPTYIFSSVIWTLKMWR